ncbi:MAG: BolA protein [Pelagibacterales bacterium]|nr:BolA protein [Pelagibacterales bacterium]
MTNFLDKIKEKINNNLKPEKILLVDNSNLHKKHKLFDAGKFNLKLIIESKKLKNMSKIEAHKIIFFILKEEMQNKIHALEIHIK